MKIDGNSPILNLKAYLIKKEETEPSNETPQKEVSSSSESVQLSARAKEIIKIQRLLESTPEIRQEKVEAIKKQIEEGTLRIDSREVAKKMIEEHLIDLIVC